MPIVEEKRNYTIMVQGSFYFFVIGLDPIGCVPYVIASFSQDPNKCYERYNEIVIQYSLKIMIMIQQLNQDLPGAHVLYWNVYRYLRQIIDSLSQYGMYIHFIFYDVLYACNNMSLQMCILLLFSQCRCNFQSKIIVSF
ncbi:hypothetical protein AQUCO_04800005v1 [Aquilegia coerulea]|uniref:Uncharacterized protein n=1 Tax=Aquilegia coerulea TaxID=218851 RepID=A0A2G5CKH0_AQUCA|nr:hypothetical protein AQUCO_04800005v1 [Aquilegia coerulea]